MLIYFLSAITSLIIIFTLYFALWLTSQGIAQFHHNGMERVRRAEERDKCLELLIELDKMAHNEREVK